MKVLYLSSRFPWPPHRGDRQASYQLLRSLSRRHDVVLASFVDGHEQMLGSEDVKGLCSRVETVHLSRTRSWMQAIAGLLSPEPSQVSYYHSAAMYALVRHLVDEERPDAIVVHLFRMAPFVEGIAHPCKVLFLCDALALALKRSLPYQPWFRRPGVRWECRRVRRYEPDCARGFRENWVVSDVDAQDLEARGCPRVAVLPLGVDERLLSLPLEPRRVPRVAFLGNLSVPHNVDAANWLAREIWPLVRAALPAAELEIVGADPLPQVLALADLPGVSVTGALPSLLPVWERSALLLAPLRFSSGVQYKLLEPMAAGVPVVTTLQAAEAIGARDGVELRTGTDAASLAAAAIDVLGAGERLMPMLGAARELVRRRFSWETLVDRLERLAAGGDSH